MAAAPTIANIISIISICVNVVLVILTSIQASNSKEQTVTAREAAKVANTALCQTLETGLDTVELARIAVFQGAYISKFKNKEEEEEYRGKLKSRTDFFNRLYSERDCPARLGE